MKLLFARCPGSPSKGMDRVKITSVFSPTQVYVARLVKSSGRFGKRRFLIDRSSIREVLRSSGPAYPKNSPIPVRWYQWTCPECGDVCEDECTTHETMCHNNHVVKLCVADDGVSERMVAEVPNA